MLENNFNSKKGFTLIELIVVIGILAILATVGLVALNPLAQFQKATDARRKSDLAQIQKALETYYQDNGSYPLSSVTAPLYKIQVPGQTTPTTIDWGKQWQPYMNLVPQDPNSYRHYVYYSTGQSYFLYASLDRGNMDPQSCQGMDDASNNECLSIQRNGIAPDACGGPCNFGATTPNVSP